MIGALFIGLAVGFFLSIPPGPIAVAVMKQSIEGNYKHGLGVGLGASTMDTIYSLFAIFASSAIIVTLQNALRDFAWMQLAFQVICVIAFVIVGVRYLKPTTKKVAETAQQEERQEERARKMGYNSPYLVGILMSIANLASPTFIPMLIAVAGYLHANDLVSSDVGECIAYAVGFGGGAALWFFVLLKTIYKWRTRLSAGFISRIYQFAGLSFIFFAIVLAFNVIRTTRWSDYF